MENNLIPLNIVDQDVDDEYFFNSIAPGFRFKPTNDECIVLYLMPKINNQELPRNRINIANVYDCSPHDLLASGRYKSTDKNEWYFFTPRKRKYKGGGRPDRAAGNGFWKAIETNKDIKHNGELVGYRRTLTYILVEHSKEIKTEWNMHEFTVKNPPAPVRTTEDSMRLDDWVFCKVYKRAVDSRKRKRNEEGNNNAEQVVADEIENPTPVNAIFAREEHVAAHDEAMAQIIYTNSQLQPLNEGPPTISFAHGDCFLWDGTPPTLLNDQTGVTDGPNNNFGFCSDITPVMSMNDQVGIMSLNDRVKPINGATSSFGDPLNIGPLGFWNDQMGMLVGPNNNSGFLWDITPVTPLKDQVGMMSFNDLVKPINGPSGDFGDPLNIAPLVSWNDQVGMIVGPTQMFPKPQDHTPENGFSAGCCSQYSMNPMPTLISERTQRNGTHEILGLNDNSTHNIAGCSQYTPNPMLMGISRRSQNHEFHESSWLNESWAHDLGGYPQDPMNDAEMSILNYQFGEIPRTDMTSRQNMNHMQMRIPKGHQDEIPKTLRADSSWTQTGGSFQHMMNHYKKIRISNHYPDEIHETLRVNDSSTHNIEGCPQPPMNRTSMPILG